MVIGFLCVFDKKGLKIVIKVQVPYLDADTSQWVYGLPYSTLGMELTVWTLNLTLSSELSC